VNREDDLAGTIMWSEVQRLRHLLGEQEALALRYLARADKADAEVARLRAALEWVVAVTAYSAYVDPTAEGPARGFVTDMRIAHRFARRGLRSTSAKSDGT